MKNFWQEIPRPILGLAPMDGVTDAAYRLIAARRGGPDVVLTEFTNVEGLSRNADVMLDDFIYDEAERPAVAQIYGKEPESFYKVAMLACELGFDGIDVNMGCPAKNVASRGCGAGLIRTPELAKEIIRAVQAGVRDWAAGRNIDDLGLKPRMGMKVRRMNLARVGLEAPVTERLPIPVSVKTRLGFDSIIVEDWVKHLLETEPAAICLHGRTLKQMYTGSADWDAIARAAEIIHQTPTLALGNGDIQSLEEALLRVKQSGVDGILIGRAAIGAPWIFRGKAALKEACVGRFSSSPLDPLVSLTERFAILLEHARLFESIKGLRRFSAMRKHFAFYCKGIPRAAELRNRMFQTRNPEDVERVLNEYLGALAGGTQAGEGMGEISMPSGDLATSSPKMSLPIPS